MERSLGEKPCIHYYITYYDVIFIELGEDNLTRKVNFIDYNGPSNHPHQVSMWFRRPCHISLESRDEILD
jgi:hypothetical protein